MEVKPYSCLIDIDDMGSVVVLSLTVEWGVGMERQGPSYGEVVSTRDVRVQAFSGEVKALRLGARRRSSGLYVYGLQGCEPFTLRWGVAYIVPARPLRPSVMRGLKYIKSSRYW